MTAQSKPREPYDGFDWERDSLAVVACDGNGNGAVLWTVGAHINFEIQESGLGQLGDLGLDDAPLGISIWTGKYIGLRGPWECPEDGLTEPVGKFRPPTDEEWTAIRAGRCPWSEEEWRAADPPPNEDHAIRVAWERSKEKEPENSTHPCDDWHWEKCMCKGACSCHERAIQEGRK